MSICLAVSLPLQSCKRKAVPHSAEQKPEASQPAPAETAGQQGQEVEAAWYNVPVLSLARRRAGLSELTAAHNKLPLGTLVHVTHLANGKSVNVRITDRGIHDRRVKLDLCREAAEELGMVGQGTARVRIEVVPEAGAPDAKALKVKNLRSHTANE